MVQLEKVQGQRGHMVVHEDGTIISSSGELASSESTAQQIVNLVSHVFLVNLQTASPGPSGDVNNGNINGPANVNGTGSNGGQAWKWNRLTVDFGDHSYVACLSNRKIHIVKRDHVYPDPDHVNG